jgi:hypothetical protein
MRRIILSIILGILFPVICVVILVFIGDYFPLILVKMNFYGKPAPGILFAPFTIPIYLSIFLNRERILPIIFDTVWFRAISLVLFNWMLYGTVSYLILGQFERFKKKSVEASHEPPAPPSF